MRLTRVSIFILFIGLTVIGQTNKGGISGTVTDVSGNAVPGAKVTVTNAGTNQTVTLTTSDSGSFTASSLEPVIYTVTVEAPNFKISVVENIKVDTASIQSVNVALEAGNIAEKVTIEAETPLLNTESGTIGQTVTERQLQDLPLNNRSVLDLAVTVPNVSGDAGSEDPEVTSGQPVPGFNLSLNGGRPGSTSILADGVNNTGVGLARAVVSFTPETVQEFTVQTSAYSAEYGQTGGGVINATTKSGTNLFNGTALWYTRNPATNAQPYRIGTAPRTPNNLRYNQVSVTVGGPIFLPAFGEGGPAFYDGRNRSFFFFAWEPRWRQDFVTQSALLPTEAERNGDFRGLKRVANGWIPESVANQFNIPSTGLSAIYQQFTLQNGRLVPIVLAAGNRFCQFGETPSSTANGPQCLATNTTVTDALNVIPQAFINPTAREVLSFLPKGGDYFTENGQVFNYIVNRQVNQDETRYTLRLDHNFTQNNKINFRYTMTPAIGIRNFGSDVNGSTGVYSDAKQLLIGNDYIITPNIVNSLKLNYTRGIFSEDFAPEFSINGGRNLGAELGLTTSLTSGGMPLFNTSADGYGAFASIGSSGSTNNFNVEERYNINDIVYWNRGTQSWKFGVDLSYARLNVVPFFAGSGGRWNFRVVNTSRNRNATTADGGTPFASLLLGVAHTVDLRPLLLNYDYRWKAGAVFFQDDWKVKPNLTLNLGVRYALQFPRTEKNNLQGVFRPDLAVTQTLTTAQRNAIITGLGVASTNPNFNAVVASIPTSVEVPVFAFAGRGGRSRYLVPVDYKAIEPRFGFAYSPKLWNWVESRNAVIRGGFGYSHAPLTGNNRIPNPDFGATQLASTTATGSGVGDTPNSSLPITLTNNQPRISSGTLDQRLGITSDGLVVGNSLAITTGFASPEDAGKVPYSLNWNLSLSFEVWKNTVLEVAYVGARGKNLYTPFININPADNQFTELLEASNVSAEATFADPLGRTNALGGILQIPRNSVAAPFLGFNTLNEFFNPQASSIRHAGYVQLQQRFARGFSYTVNYTYGKSIDDASDASPDVRVLTAGSTLGQVFYGAPLRGDRSISTFDIKHNFSSTFIWDLPFGKKGWLFKNAPAVVEQIIGGWTASGVVRLQGGQPFLPFITDTNRLNGVNRTVRLNVIEGVPIKNPLYNSNCSIGAACEPYINPAAFMRPPKGSLGNAPRTIDVRAPMQEYFDFSLQKTFPMPFFSNEGKRRINFRIDLINAFNHPNFRFFNTGNTPPGYGTLPSEAAFTENDLVNWRAANPGQTVTLTQVNQILSDVRAQSPTNALPLGFFSIQVPEGFATKNANSFDIRTLEGLRLYRLRQSYDSNFGTLFAVNNPRYIQFGLRLFF